MQSTTQSSITNLSVLYENFAGILTTVYSTGAFLMTTTIATNWSLVLLTLMTKCLFFGMIRFLLTCVVPLGHKMSLHQDSVFNSFLSHVNEPSIFRMHTYNTVHTANSYICTVFLFCAASIPISTIMCL